MISQVFILFTIISILLQCNGFLTRLPHYSSSLVESRSRNFQLHAVKAITSHEEFASLIQNPTASELPVIVDYQKSKCRPCQKAAPIYHALSERYASVAHFYKVDADSWAEALSLMKKHGVRTVPTFQLWMQGTIMDTITGNHLDELEMILQRAEQNQLSDILEERRLQREAAALVKKEEQPQLQLASVGGGNNGIRPF